jgi:hypothetical protein
MVPRDHTKGLTALLDGASNTAHAEDAENLALGIVAKVNALLEIACPERR